MIEQNKPNTTWKNSYRLLKERAAFFLIEMRQFKPFCPVLRTDKEIVDIVRNPQCCSLELMYEILIKRVQQDLIDTEIKASAIVFTGKVDGYGAVVIENFSTSIEKYQVVFPYAIIGEIVTFGPDQNKQYQIITN